MNKCILGHFKARLVTNMSSLGSSAKEFEYLLFGLTQLFVCLLSAKGRVPKSEKAPVAVHKIQHGHKVSLAWMKQENQGCK